MKVRMNKIQYLVIVLHAHVSKKLLLNIFVVWLGIASRERERGRGREREREREGEREREREREREKSGTKEEESEEKINSGYTFVAGELVGTDA
jgi:hypothetical protein